MMVLKLDTTQHMAPSRTLTSNANDWGCLDTLIYLILPTKMGEHPCKSDSSQVRY